MKIRINKVKLFFNNKNNLSLPQIEILDISNSISGQYRTDISSIDDLKFLLNALGKKSSSNEAEIHIQLDIPKKLKIIKAGGGVVSKNDKILLIHRLGVWDLPKGKMEKNEDKKECALREVEEECGVKVKLGDKICNSVHYYENDLKFYIKMTYWYSMNCLDDSNMTPQKEEGIEKVEWKSQLDALKAIDTSYQNIKTVLNIYYKSKGKN